MASESDNTQQYSVDNADSDGTAFKLPGDNPGEAVFETDSNNGQYWRWYVHIENGWDVDVDVTVEGSHSLDAATNNTLDSPAVDGATETITSGAIDFFDGTTNHSQLQLAVDPLADPSSGSLTVTIEKRKS